MERKGSPYSIMRHPKKNLFSQSIDLDVDHVESNLKQSTKILQEMKENLAKEVKY